MEYHFGTSVSSSMFEPTDSTLINLIKYEVVQALKTLEPRITVDENEVEIFNNVDSEGLNRVYAEIPYTVNDFTNSTHIAIIDLGGDN